MSVLGTIQAAQRSANRANLQRYQQGLGLYDQMIAGWKEGGGFVKGAEATLARTKTKDVASGMQSLASSGLAGTTVAAGLPKKWEEEVGTPARLGIADIAGQRLMQAQQAKAGFIERREDTGPDYGAIMSAMQQAGQQDPYGGRTTFGASSFRNKGGVVRQQTSASQPSISRARRTGYKAPAPYHPAGSTFAQQYKTAKQRMAGTDPYAGKYSG